MIFKKNLMNFIIISIVFASILVSKNWALYRNATKIKKVYFFGNEFVDNNFLNSLTVFLGMMIDGIPSAPSGSLSLT